jgi:hypothetical protein
MTYKNKEVFMLLYEFYGRLLINLEFDIQRFYPYFQEDFYTINDYLKLKELNILPHSEIYLNLCVIFYWFILNFKNNLFISLETMKLLSKDNTMKFNNLNSSFEIIKIISVDFFFISLSTVIFNYFNSKFPFELSRFRSADVNVILFYLFDESLMINYLYSLSSVQPLFNNFYRSPYSLFINNFRAFSNNIVDKALAVSKDNLRLKYKTINCLELINLSVCYICSFSTNNNNNLNIVALQTSNKFFEMQCLVFAYQVLISFISYDFKDDLLGILLNMFLSVFNLTFADIQNNKYFNNFFLLNDNKNFYKAHPLSLLLPIYGSSKLFMSEYNKFMDFINKKNKYSLW